MTLLLSSCSGLAANKKAYTRTYAPTHTLHEHTQAQ